MELKSLDIIKGKEIENFTYMRDEDGRIQAIEIQFKDETAVRIDPQKDCLLWVGYWNGVVFDCLND
jgi:hypothetical protein